MFRSQIKNFINAPIAHHVAMKILNEYDRPNDKISELLKNQELISIRRGLYIPGPKIDLPSPNNFLIANHLRGPSYVSLESALSFWGMIPERVFEISSVTLKSSKNYKTAVGRFSFQQLNSPYYSFGIERIEIEQKQFILIASKEKALCDKIILTSGVLLRSVSQTQDFLLEDLRIDDDALKTLNCEMIETWIDDAPKKSSLKMLLKTLEAL
jgi:hypothetical protein